MPLGPAHHQQPVRAQGQGLNDASVVPRVQVGAKAAPAVGVYFPVGNVGVLSAPLSLESTVSVWAETQGRFVRSVRETYGIALTPGVELADEPTKTD
jgi:hypothetical protein